MSSDARDALLYSQMQVGLKLKLMESPAVSGTADYKQLCVAARNEEKRLKDLEKRREYLRSQPTSPQPSAPDKPDTSQTRSKYGSDVVGSAVSGRQCYICGVWGHISRDCGAPRTESGGRGWTRNTNSRSATKDGGATRFVGASNREDEDIEEDATECLYSCLYPSHTNDVRQVRIPDKGSHPQRVQVLLEGVPVMGVVDSGADITIIGKGLLKRVATAAKLGRDRLRRVDKVPKTYDGRPFTLHGRLDLDVSFEGTTLRTPVYVKLDTSEPLLLSEGVCRQLSIINYHPRVVGQRVKHHARLLDHQKDDSMAVDLMRESSTQTSDLNHNPKQFCDGDDFPQDKTEYNEKTYATQVFPRSGIENIGMSGPLVTDNADDREVLAGEVSAPERPQRNSVIPLPVVSPTPDSFDTQKRTLQENPAQSVAGGSHRDREDDSAVKPQETARSDVTDRQVREEHVSPVTSHPVSWKEGQKTVSCSRKTSAGGGKEDNAHVYLLQSLRLLPGQSSFARGLSWSTLDM